MREVNAGFNALADVYRHGVKLRVPIILMGGGQSGERLMQCFRYRRGAG